MQPPRRHYGALRETEREVAERAGAPTETPTRFSSDTPTAEFVSEIDLLEARRAAREAELQEKVDLGRIGEGDKARGLARFDNDSSQSNRQRYARPVSLRRRRGHMREPNWPRPTN
jgi:hypothetical protein